MSEAEIARILEAINGIGTRLDKLETQSETNGQEIAILSAELRGLKEQVNRMNPIWTAIFNVMRGYGNLVNKSALSQTFALVFWSLVIAILIIAGANKAGLDTGSAWREVDGIVKESKDMIDGAREGSPSPTAPLPVTDTTGAVR